MLQEVKFICNKMNHRRLYRLESYVNNGRGDIYEYKAAQIIKLPVVTAVESRKFT